MSAVLGLHYPRRCVLGTGESGDVATCAPQVCVRGEWDWDDWCGGRAGGAPGRRAAAAGEETDRGSDTTTVCGTSGCPWHWGGGRRGYEEVSQPPPERG